MITTLLFDLDDTLLDNDLGQFLPAYFRTVAGYFPEAESAQALTRELVNATRAMIANSDPARVLFDVFADCFTQGTGWHKDFWWPRLQAFYAGRYQELQSLTNTRPAARPALDWALGAGYEIAVTTNPLFPQAAIRERLRWAGLDDFPFSLVTSVDQSHFAKPRPEFYAEALASLGKRPEQALVIGDSWVNDIGAAEAAALKTYWINGRGADVEQAFTGGLAPVAEAHPLASGTLDDFLAWAPDALGQAGGQIPTQPALPPGASLPYYLVGNLGVLSGRLAGLSEAQWRQRPSPGEWSLTELVCHLRDVEQEVNLPRLHAVVKTDNPFVAGADTDPWARERDYQSQNGPEALADFLAARQQAANFLRRQPASIWTRTARHAIFGPTQLVEIVGWILDHDRIHLEQVKSTVARVSD